MNLLTEVDMNLMDKASWFSKHPGKLVEKLSNTPLKRRLAGAYAGLLGGYGNESVQFGKCLGKLDSKANGTQPELRLAGACAGLLGGYRYCSKRNRQAL
jgi:hypothetical protein